MEGAESRTKGFSVLASSIGWLSLPFGARILDRTSGIRLKSSINDWRIAPLYSAAAGWNKGK